MISDTELAAKEAEITGLLGTMEVNSLVTPHSSEERIERILRRAKLESIIRDSAGRLADGMGRNLLGITDAMISATRADQFPESEEK